MGEINITAFFTGAAPMDYSASVAEIGRTAGADTWRAAVEDSPDYMLLDTEYLRQEFRDYVRGFGAWEAQHIASWSDVELNALLLQMIAGDMREVPEMEMGPNMSAADWTKYQEFAESGIVSSRIFQSGADVYWTMD